MTRQVSFKAGASRKRIASFQPASSTASLENNLLTAYMGFIRESEMPLERFVSHGGWLLEQSRISPLHSEKLIQKALEVEPLHPRLAGQLHLLAAFLADPPAETPATALRDSAFAGYFVLEAPGALVADHAAVVETTLQIHGRTLKKFCRARQMPWDPFAPKQAA
jgi:hypothetical protein